MTKKSCLEVIIAVTPYSDKMHLQDAVHNVVLCSAVLCPNLLLTAN